VQGRKPIRRIEKLADPDSESPPSAESTDGLSEEEISLEDLGNAYAAVMQWEQPSENSAAGTSDGTGGGRGRDLSGDAEAGPLVGATVDRASELDAEQVVPTIVDHSIPTPSESDGVPIDLCSILEALLFVGTQDAKPIPKTALLELLRDFHEQEIDEAVRQLNESHRQHASALEIRHENDAYVLRVTDAMLPVLERIQSPVKETQLTQFAIDCLSLIAYQPGITKESLETQWGQPAGGILSNLIKKGLVTCESDRADPPSKGNNPDAIADQVDTTASPRYFTTERFLAILGLESLDDLPRGDEV
jgi:segregation and condensation protein B